MKRIYATDGSGKSAPAWFVRPVLILGFPFILANAALEEIASGFRGAWLSIRVETESFKRIWNSAK